MISKGGIERITIYLKGPGCNTAPANWIKPSLSDPSDKGGISVLHIGIDSLYLSYQGELHTDIEAKLEKCKEKTQPTVADIHSQGVIYLADHCFEVRHRKN